MSPAFSLQLLLPPTGSGLCSRQNRRKLRMRCRALTDIRGRSSQLWSRRVNGTFTLVPANVVAEARLLAGLRRLRSGPSLWEYQRQPTTYSAPSCKPISTLNYSLPGCVMQVSLASHAHFVFCLHILCLFNVPSLHVSRSKYRVVHDRFVANKTTVTDKPYL
jgi:hypothetical protein